MVASASVAGPASRPVGELARPPDESSALYLARGIEVSASRPVMTGDVFEDVVIPGVDGVRGPALVLAHPCAIRDGAHLRDRVMMCAVRKGAPIRSEHWLGNFGVMPLPDLLHDGGLKHRAVFDLAGRVATADLDLARRRACLDEQGIVLMLQRLTFSYTRLAVDVEALHESIAHVLEEANLLEEWVEERAASVGRPLHSSEIRESESEFDALMLQVDPVAGTSNRQRLNDPMARASVRRLVRRTLVGWPPTATDGE